MSKQCAAAEIKGLWYYVILSMTISLSLILIHEFVEHVLFPGTHTFFTHVILSGCFLLIIGGITYVIGNKERKILAFCQVATENLLQKNAEYVERTEALIESIERYKKLVLHIPGMAFQFKMDDDGNFSVPFSTDGIYEIFGVRKEEVEHSFTPILSVISEEDRPTLIESIHRSAEHMTLWQQEFRICLPDSQVKWVFGQSTPELLPDGSIVWSGHVTDITNHRNIQDERMRFEQNRSLGLLAGGLAHDFNNILSVILGYISILSEKEKDAANKILFDSIMRATERLIGLIRRLQAFSKGGSADSLKRASVANIIKESAEFFLGESSKSKCVLELPDNLWFIHVDILQIQLLFQNLIINASQAMPDGGIVKISARNEEDPLHVNLRGNYVHISVADTGVGIHEKYKERIFEPHFTTKQESSGSGLGLAIVLSIVQHHKGKISVESTPGKGTTFHIYLPALLETCVEYTPTTDDHLEHGSLRILLMDDDIMLQQTIKHMLIRLNHRVVITADGTEAIREFKKAEEAGRPFDIVILDLTIPGGMGGAETLENLLKIKPDLRSIISSGYSDHPVPKECTLTLPKPYVLRGLRNAIAEAMNHKQESS